MSTWNRSAAFSGEDSLQRQKYVFVAVLIALSVILGLALVGLTPSTAIPIGVIDKGGVSMTPTYGTDGIAIYGPGTLESGDVVVFYEEQNTNVFTMHRVVRETEQGFVTKGDALSMTDQSMGRSYVTEETRVGEVYLVIDSKGVHFPAL